MLEIEENGPYATLYDKAKMEGQCIGYSEASLIYCQKFLKIEKKYKDCVRKYGIYGVPETIQIAYRNYLKLMLDEGVENVDLLFFLEKYESLPLSSVRDRVWRESEYWHGPHRLK